MPLGLVKTDRDERLWAKATSAAEKQGKSKNYAYINGIYQKMKGHKKTASATPLLDSIKDLSSDGWYGFKIDKNEHGTPMARVFSPTLADTETTITQPPKRILGAAECIDWMTVPSDNIDGVPKNEREKELAKKSSLLHAISSLEITKDNVDTNAPIHEVEGDSKQAELDRSVSESCGKAINLLEAIQKEARVLSTRGRKRVAKKNFAMPASAAKSGKGQKGSYPIHTIKHARSDLSYGKRFLSADEYSKLRARVYTKYPSLKKTASATPLLDDITKQAIGKPLMLLGGIGIGALGLPALKKKYMGIHPETQQLLEEGDPNYGRVPIMPSRFFRPVQ